MRFSQKAAVADFVLDEPIFCFAEFYFGKGYSWLVTTIGTNPDMSSEFLVYDLGVDPSDLVAMSDDELRKRVGRSPKPVRALKSNAAPTLMAREDAVDGTSGADLPDEELERRATFLSSDSPFRGRLIEAFQATKEVREPSEHVEEQLYDGFFPNEDQPRLAEFHRVPWEERPPILQTLQDNRLKELGWRLIHQERPDVLDEEDRTAHDIAIARRLLETEQEVRWLTLPEAFDELDEVLANGDAALRLQMAEVRDYLTKRRERAAKVLG